MYPDTTLQDRKLTASNGHENTEIQKQRSNNKTTLTSTPIILPYYLKKEHTPLPLRIADFYHRRT